jgi:hypothetical protein
MNSDATIQKEIGAVRLWRNRYKYLTHLVLLILLLILYPFLKKKFSGPDVLKGPAHGCHGLRGFLRQ